MKRRSSLVYFPPVLSGEASGLGDAEGGHLWRLARAESEGFKSLSSGYFRRHNTSRASGAGDPLGNPFDLDTPGQMDGRGGAVSAFRLSSLTSRNSSGFRTFTKGKFVAKEFQERMESITASLSRLSREEARHFTPLTDSPDSNGSSGACLTSDDSGACPNFSS